MSQVAFRWLQDESKVSSYATLPKKRNKHWIEPITARGDKGVHDDELDVHYWNYLLSARKKSRIRLFASHQKNVCHKIWQQTYGKVRWLETDWSANYLPLVYSATSVRIPRSMIRDVKHPDKGQE
jgi:hypothetical protein